MEFSVKEARKAFFDRKVVKDAIDRARQVALARSAAMVRVIAQRSMRPAKWGGKTKPSPPGKPPRAWYGRPRGTDKAVREFTWFAYDLKSKSAVIGPVRLGSRARTVPNLLEFGGSVKRRTVTRKVGDAGEIRVQGIKGGKSGKAQVDKAGKSTKVIRTASGRSALVTFAKLRTQAQVARANQLNQELYGSRFGSAVLRPRPFMAPAMLDAVPQMPSHWKNTVRST